MLKVESWYNSETKRIEAKMNLEGEDNLDVIEDELEAIVYCVAKVVGENSDLSAVEYLRSIAADIEDGNDLFPREDDE